MLSDTEDIYTRAPDTQVRVVTHGAEGQEWKYGYMRASDRSWKVHQ
jgi:hypothetical protein